MAPHRGMSDDQRRTAFLAVSALVVGVVVLLGVLGGKGHKAPQNAARSAQPGLSGTAPRSGMAPRIVDAAATGGATATTPTVAARQSSSSAGGSSSGPRTVVPTPPGFHARCHYQTYPDGAIVPDPSCTPGVLNRAAAANPRSAICAAGHSSKHQSPDTHTEPLKITDMVKYGSVGPPSAYQEDQLVPVEDGGSPRDPKNLWPEYLYGTGGALQKDKAEDRVHQLICSGKITVTQGASLLEGDWLQVLSSKPRRNP